MKVITETVDKVTYIEFVLSDFDLDLIEDERMISKEKTLNNHKFSLSVRKETPKETYEND